MDRRAAATHGNGVHSTTAQTSTMNNGNSLCEADTRSGAACSRPTPSSQSRCPTSRTGSWSPVTEPSIWEAQRLGEQRRRNELQKEGQRGCNRRRISATRRRSPSRLHAQLHLQSTTAHLSSSPSWRHIQVGIPSHGTGKMNALGFKVLATSCRRKVNE